MSGEEKIIFPGDFNRILKVYSECSYNFAADSVYLIVEINNNNNLIIIISHLHEVNQT